MKDYLSEENGEGGSLQWGTNTQMTAEKGGGEKKVNRRRKTLSHIKVVEKEEERSLKRWPK